MRIDQAIEFWTKPAIRDLPEQETNIQHLVTALLYRKPRSPLKAVGPTCSLQGVGGTIQRQRLKVIDQLNIVAYLSVGRQNDSPIPPFHSLLCRSSAVLIELRKAEKPMLNTEGYLPK